MALRTPAFNDAKSYGFEWLRAMLEVALQEGVVGTGDLKVTAAAAGGMRVDIAAGSALVKGDSGVPATGLSQGLFLIVNDAAVANAVTLNASDATNPRLDQIVLRARDSADLGSGADDAIFEVVTGAPTAGATLDNRSGAAALPNDRVRLADVLVPAASVAVTAGNVRDRRPWARGMRFEKIGTSDVFNSSAAWRTGAAIAAGVDFYAECSGAPVEVTLTAAVGTGGTGITNAERNIVIAVDDVVPGASPQGHVFAYTANSEYSIPLQWTTTPAAGRHRFDIGIDSAGSGSGQSGLIRGSWTTLRVREVLAAGAST